MSKDLFRFIRRYPGLDDQEVASSMGASVEDIRVARSIIEEQDRQRRTLAGLTDEELTTLNDCIELAVSRLRDEWVDYQETSEEGRRREDRYERASALNDKLSRP